MSLPQIPWKGSSYSPIDSSGGPPNDGGMEARVAKLETNVENIVEVLRDLRQDTREIRNHQERDFRILFGVIITTTIGLAGLMAKGFGWL